MNIKKNVLNIVVDYVKNLMPICTNNNVVAKSKEELELDAKTLVYLSTGNLFFTHARNGREYFYCFIANELDINVAKHLLQSNGLKPKTHISRYYHTPMLVLRARAADIEKNENARKFIDCVTTERTKYIRYEYVHNHLNQIRQKIK
ncbi:MAG: hypothetical protein UIC65_05090 [Alphaproteobacteria bacterium]|nr:hypothetical protein [Alphaproteobacteria bacterium]